MMSFKIYGYTVRMKHGFQSVRNLLTFPFLHGEAFGEDPNQAGQQRNSGGNYLTLPFIEVSC